MSKVEFKKALFNLGKQLLLMFSKIIGLTLFSVGVSYKNIWIVISGFALVDLTPSFIKQGWKSMDYYSYKINMKNKK